MGWRPRVEGFWIARADEDEAIRVLSVGFGNKLSVKKTRESVKLLQQLFNLLLQVDEGQRIYAKLRRSPTAGERVRDKKKLGDGDRFSWLWAVGGSKKSGGLTVAPLPARDGLQHSC